MVKRSKNVNNNKSKEKMEEAEARKKMSFWEILPVVLININKNLFYA